MKWNVLYYECLFLSNYLPQALIKIIKIKKCRTKHAFRFVVSLNTLFLSLMHLVSILDLDQRRVWDTDDFTNANVHAESFGVQVNFLFETTQV